MNRLPTLDGWRAIAILMVIACHSWGVWRFQAGVDVFFAISGLLITTRLLEDRDLGKFYIRRAFRILPPVLCYLGLLWLAGLFVWRWEALSALTFWRNYYMAGNPGGYTGHFWSLSLEEQFYLIWPFALCWLGNRRAPAAVFWLIVGQNVWRTYVLMSGGVAVMTRGDLRADGLAWGVLAAFALRFRPSVKVPGWTVLPSFGAAMALYHFLPAMAVIPIAFAASVLGTVQNPTSRFSRLLELPPLVWIGKRSYGLYVWQQLVLAWNAPLWLRVVVLLIVTVSSYELVELPLQRLGRRLAARAGSGNNWIWKPAASA